MLTKQQAWRFRERLNNGEFPPLPKKAELVLKMSRSDIFEVKCFHERGTLLNMARRLVQMGLFDKNWRLTNYGDGYLKENK